MVPAVVLGLGLVTDVVHGDLGPDVVRRENCLQCFLLLLEGHGGFLIACAPGVGDHDVVEQFGDELGATALVGPDQPFVLDQEPEEHDGGTVLGPDVLKEAGVINQGFLDVGDCRRVGPRIVKRGLDSTLLDFPDLCLLRGDVQIPREEELQFGCDASVVKLLEG